MEFNFQSSQFNTFHKTKLKTKQPFSFSYSLISLFHIDYIFYAHVAIISYVQLLQNFRISYFCSAIKEKLGRATCPKVITFVIC